MRNYLVSEPLTIYNGLQAARATFIRLIVKTEKCGDMNSISWIMPMPQSSE